jgi:hypothetical protein
MKIEELRHRLDNIRVEKSKAIREYEYELAAKLREEEKSVLHQIQSISKVHYNNYTPDSIVQTVVENFVKRAEMGEKKYGVTLDREDLTIEDFIEHALQEHMDAILYLQKVKTMLEKQKNG